MPPINIHDVDVFRQTAFGPGEEMITDTTGTYDDILNTEHWSLAVPAALADDLSAGRSYYIQWEPDPVHQQRVTSAHVRYIGYSNITGMARFASP